MKKPYVRAMFFDFKVLINDKVLINNTNITGTVTGLMVDQSNGKQVRVEWFNSGALEYAWFDQTRLTFTE